MATTSTKSSKPLNNNAKKSINIIKNHVQTKSLKSNISKSNNGSLKRKPGFKGVVQQTTKSQEKNLEEKVCSFFADGFKLPKPEEKTIEISEIQIENNNKVDSTVEEIENLTLNDNDIKVEPQEEQPEAKEEKVTTAQETKDSNEKFSETAMARIRIERLIKLRFLRRAKDDGDSKMEDVKDPPFRNFVATGKYLHETDKRWCLRYTKLASEKDILKWLKRFRTLCPKGQMGMDQLKIVYNKIFCPGGDPEFFCSEVMARFDIEEKNALDFKVFLFLIQISLFSTNTEKLNWIVQLLDLDDTGMIHMAEIETAVRFFEELERRIRNINLFEMDSDLDFDPIPSFDGQRQKALNDRMSLIKSYLELPEETTYISRDTLASMPLRHISSFWEDVEEAS